MRRVLLRSFRSTKFFPSTTVIDGDGGGGGVLVLALLEIGEKLGVGMHGLFFEVAGEAVSEFGRRQVAQEVEVEGVT